MEEKDAKELEKEKLRKVFETEVCVPINYVKNRLICSNNAVHPKVV